MAAARSASLTNCSTMFDRYLRSSFRAKKASPSLSTQMLPNTISFVAASRISGSNLRRQRERTLVLVLESTLFLPARISRANPPWCCSKNFNICCMCSFSISGKNLLS